MSGRFGSLAVDDGEEMKTWDIVVENAHGQQSHHEISAPTEREAIKKSRDYGRFVRIVCRVYR
jgi:hypothetical protein